jgi:hypothetical protein
MADTTAAQRQRRYRAHKQGDHSLCAPGRPECVTVTASVTRDAPRGPRLRARGQRMWDQLVGDDDPIEVVVLVEEICRLADRLDRLDAIVNGRDRAWLTLEVPDDGTAMTVVVDKVLTEARQQQTTFKTLLAELRAMRGTSAKTPGGRRAPKEAGGVGGGGITDLTARIARRTQPAG